MKKTFFGAAQENVNFKASFTRRKEDILEIKEILRQEGAEQTFKLFQKIENQEGYDNLREILGSFRRSHGCSWRLRC